MSEYRKVRSSREISIRIANLLEDMRGRSFGASRAETVRDINDVLQGRGTQPVETFLTGLRNMGGFMYEPRVEEVSRDIQAFLEQKALLAQPYTKTGHRRYQYRSFDLDPEHPLKVVGQSCYDQAAADGFPSGFFRGSYFDRVSFYCLPDGADLSGSRFDTCNFPVCRIVGADFGNTAIFSSSFGSCRIWDASFSGAVLAHTHFQDCDMKCVTFESARLSRGNFIDCTMEEIDFLCATLDGVSCGRVTTDGIKNLDTAIITEGGATNEEVARLRTAIFEALRAADFPSVQKKRPARSKPHRIGPER